MPNESENKDAGNASEKETGKVSKDEDLLEKLTILANAVSNVREMLLKTMEKPKEAPSNKEATSQLENNSGICEYIFVPPKPQIPAVILNEETDFET